MFRLGGDQVFRNYNVVILDWLISICLLCLFSFLVLFFVACCPQSLVLDFSLDFTQAYIVDSVLLLFLLVRLLTVLLPPVPIFLQFNLVNHLDPAPLLLVKRVPVNELSPK